MILAQTNHDTIMAIDNTKQFAAPPRLKGYDEAINKLTLRIQRKASITTTAMSDATRRRDDSHEHPSGRSKHKHEWG